MHPLLWRGGRCTPGPLGARSCPPGVRPSAGGVSAWPRGRLGSWGHAERALPTGTAPAEGPVPTKLASGSGERPVLISRTLIREVGARPDLSRRERLRESRSGLVRSPARAASPRRWWARLAPGLVSRPLLASAGGIGAAPAVLFGKQAALRGEVALGARWEPAAQDPPLAGEGGGWRSPPLPPP